MLQARPITALPGHNPAAGEWNDSLTGDYLWTNGNLGEAVPDVMTPCTWSFVQIGMEKIMAVPIRRGRIGSYGNIGGRLYMNLSLTASLGRTFGATGVLDEAMAEGFGRLPGDPEIPLVPLSRWRLVRKLLPIAIQIRRQNKADLAAPARVLRRSRGT